MPRSEGRTEKERGEARRREGLYYTAITVPLSHTHTHRVEERTYGHRRTFVRSPVYLQEIYSCRHASGSGRRRAGVQGRGGGPHGGLVSPVEPQAAATLLGSAEKRMAAPRIE